MLRRILLLACVLPGAVFAEPTGAPAYLLEVPQSVATVLVAETGTSTLFHFANSPRGVELVGRSYMSVGQNGVGKERAWDRKTPLGIYFINEQLDTTKLHKKYGPTAFPLDYPNTWDRRNGRSGDGIWLHGVAPDGGKRPPLDTDGCIALPNDELLALAGQLQPRVTPMLVTRHIAWGDTATVAEIRNALQESVDTWSKSLQQGDLHHLFGLYAKDFSYRGMNRAEWQAFRSRAIAAAPLQRVELEDLLLLADPTEAGLYLSRFEQRLVYAGRTVTTLKRLYWRRLDSGEFRIVAEDNG